MALDVSCRCAMQPPQARTSGFGSFQMSKDGASRDKVLSSNNGAVVVSAAAAAEASAIAILTVTFHPNLEKLRRQIDSLPSDAALVVVDNSSNETEYAALSALVGRRASTKILRNETNIGLAAALNQGAEYVSANMPSREFLLLMDQDSAPRSGGVSRLLEAFCALESIGLPVGCVGPNLVDDSTGLQHGFHCMQGWRWVRVFTDQNDGPVECANLNGSGTFVRLALFQQMGGLDEAMFIDHVDTDWAFRVRALGLRLYGIPQATFDHSMGERGLRYWWFGPRVWPQRSPSRLYYLFRNAVWLMWRSYVPIVWKVWAVVKLALTLAVHGLMGPKRTESLHSMLVGVGEGLKRGRNISRGCKGKK